MSGRKKTQPCRTMNSIFIFKAEIVADESNMSEQRTNEARETIVSMIELAQKRGRPSINTQGGCDAA